MNVPERDPDPDRAPGHTPAPHPTTTPETPNREAPMKHVTHWINGAPYVATEAPAPADRVGAALSALRDKAVDLIDPERSGDIYDPATGTVTGTVDFASAGSG